MKKYISLIVIFLVSVSLSAQEQKVKTEKKGDLTEATYYYDNGQISQHGFFNADGKLQGTWKQYDAEGKKIAVGNYDNGLKVGKWLFWTEDSLKEVDYVNSKIASVSNWNNKTTVAIRDK